MTFHRGGKRIDGMAPRGDGGDDAARTGARSAAHTEEVTPEQHVLRHTGYSAPPRLRPSWAGWTALTAERNVQSPIKP